MFNIGWGEFLILVIGGLLILGPERLPAAASWLARTLRQIREYAQGAREQLRSEVGPAFDEFREPMEELRGLRGFSRRGFNPRSALTRQLFDDFDRDPFDDVFKPNGYAASTGWGIPVHRPLQPGERAPFDPDAT
ncbi:MAG: Sec-independent protein translocase protein TatB [Pseudonocardiaceae bacterium]